MGLLLFIVYCGWGLVGGALAQDDAALHRWGQAVAYIPSPPSLLIHGGKSDPANGYSYTSAPNSADTILLPLTSTPLTPIVLDTPDAPAYAWHTLTPFSTHDGQYDVLSFGGDGGPAEPTQTRPDSAWYFALNPNPDRLQGVWTRQASGWGNQPERRIYHAAAGGGGKVYITGGLRNDGSGQSHAEVYVFAPANGFTSMPSLPRATYHHASVMLPNGTLIVLGGMAVDMATGMPAAQPLSRITLLNTIDSAAAWVEVSISGLAPVPRRGMAAALSDDGKTVFIHGGASTTLAEVYADAWTLDLDTLVWTQVGQSTTASRVARQTTPTPGERYDHSAIMGPGGQVIILGGYGGDSTVDPGPFVFNLPGGTWQNEFDPAPAIAAAGGAAPVGSAVGSSTPISVPANPASTPVSGAQQSQTGSPGTPNGGSSVGGEENEASRTDSSVSASGASSLATPSASASNTAADETSSGMGLPAQLGLIFGVLAAVSIGLALFCWRYRRRKRHERLTKAIYGANAGPPPARPYGGRNKGGEGLMEEARLQEMRDLGNEKAVPPIPPSKDVGLGLGAISASFASLRHFVQPKTADAYAVLHDEGMAGPGAGADLPTRKSTRKVGNGIRLIGPRTQMHEPYHPPRRAVSITTRDSRRDMLSDEDSRNFPPGAEDWEVGDISRGRWKSARSILAQHDEEEGDDDESLHPPVIRGGPVPTPHESQSNLDPFDDRQGDFGLPQVRSDPLLDLDTLLPPPMSASKRLSHLSMTSGPSTATVSDREEGVVHQAQYAAIVTSPTPSDTSAYQPVKRTDTFFRRMAAGGISSLLPAARSSSSTAGARASLFDIDIRDPAPPPSLWPVVTRDILQPPAPAASVTAVAGPSKPPTAWKHAPLPLDLSLPQRPTHHPGPSLTSIVSAKSMRDMVIVQREPTSSSGESAIIDHTPHRAEYGHQLEGSGSGSPSETSSPSEHGHQQHDGILDPTETPAMGGTPGSVVFDGAAFAASPADSTSTPKARVQPPPPTASISKTLPAPDTSPSSSRTPPSLSTPTRPLSLSQAQPRAPSGSPIPNPLLSHRRPVSEMVKSINKRNSGTAFGSNGASPVSLFSPASQYSPAPASSSPTPFPARKRPTTLYEAVKRDKLLVTNPDGRRV